MGGGDLSYKVGFNRENNIPFICGLFMTKFLRMWLNTNGTNKAP
jgi:hypothetical protein